MSEEQLKEKQRFDAHLRQLSERVYPAVEDGFDRELAKLRRVDEDVRSNLDEFYTASLGSSMAKNRFSDVKPNEGTIVRLREISASGDGTYINANYIDARKKFNVPFVYIATQAPMKNTVLDFWRMVYENDCAFIVMLCAVKENGKGKSETYWLRRGETYDMGLVSVTVVAENAREDLVHRRLLLRSVRGDEKEVYQMQYVAWPDQGVPESSATLMEIIQAIAKSPRSTQSPIVVHCSGGVGRTGVFIGMHIALAQFQLGQASISIPRIVRFMKACRSGMVRRKDQYLFLYYAVQREMERMILSEKTGVNLLEGRPRLVPTVTKTEASPPTARMASPLIMAMPAPDGHRHFRNLLAPFRSGSSVTSPMRRSAPTAITNSRQTDEDVAAMENYLYRASPASSMPRSGSTSIRDEHAPFEASHVQQLPQPQPSQSPNMSPTNLATTIPREPEPQWRQRSLFRSSASHVSENVTPLTHPSSRLQEELSRQQQANRIKRFSPSSAYRANLALSLAGAVPNEF
ncbi:putative tyrosine specific protein phosphatase [Leptomonas pyrrhocoris]|uniref:Putative tyrosine specific protein phosphatase n=1 Tax=Leptomonas pyrrhocoris TaxID=157538 RepID=A0A0N0VFR2_LEPPY|nr:putative tyrosine specific protein phosphatase [Leptomonas pyrrhocoris]KPA81628.1 putative tyrosine specific protein phosphatase [Leptomonas pyrrhocoris]|eukprot:XP_015660067.1 putative tyrosine specific protein phosphatase [Leptomonas pyrrhocoris]